MSQGYYPQHIEFEPGQYLIRVGGDPNSVTLSVPATNNLLSLRRADGTDMLPIGTPALDTVNRKLWWKSGAISQTAPNGTWA